MKRNLQSFYALAILAHVPFGWLPLLAQTNPSTTSKLPAQSMLTMGGIVATPQREASPKLVGTKLPAPPRQQVPWTPPNITLAPNHVSATTALFDAGLADPRGCNYRAVRIGTGTVWSGDGGVVDTHAWVLPGDEPQKFAVCWNGLVYPVVTVGEPADMKTDIAEVLKRPQRGWRQAIPEAVSASHLSSGLLKGCLLLRLGEPELAFALWGAMQGADQQWQAERLRRAQPVTAPEPAAVPKAEFKFNDSDPYLAMAQEWASSAFDRAVCAHMRGDDGLALASARSLNTARDTVEQTAAQRGFKKQQHPWSPWNGTYLDYLDFLSPLPALLADQERRAQSPPRTQNIRTTDLSKFKTPAERIGLLIDNLEEVAVRQHGQPGGLGNFEWDAIVATLIAEGEPAIEPILQFLDAGGGARLTRSVSFGRDFHRARTLHSVQQPATRAVLTILKIDNATLGASGPAGTNFTSSVRAYRQKYGNTSEEERWYRVLGDPMASQAAWCSALAQIIALDPATKRGGETVRPKLRGEPLRARQNPSVTDLLHKRAEEWKPTYPGSSFEPGERLEFALSLSKWDFAAFLPRLQQMMRDYIAGFEPAYKLSTDDGGTINNSYLAVQYGAPAIVRLTVERAQGGDLAALDEYARWLQIVRLGRYAGWFSADPLRSLEPLWRFPDHPVMRVASSNLFSRFDSEWRRLEWKFNSFSRSDGTPWQLLTLPEARGVFATFFTNHQAVGGVLVRADGSLATTNRQGGGSYGGKVDLNEFPIGTGHSYRHSDQLAQLLSAVPGFPRMNYLWHEARRDEALAQTRATLERYGSRLKVHEPPDAWSHHVPLRLEFPARPQPATRAEVERHEAIFHLEGQGETKIVPLPQFPLSARWVARDNQPVTVWQAEDLTREGRTERYFGVVAANEITRVPAAELVASNESRDSYGWTTLSNHWSGKITGPANATPRTVPRSSAKVAEPLRFQLYLRNATLLDRALPTDLARNAQQVGWSPDLLLRMATAPAPVQPPRLARGPFDIPSVPPPPADTWQEIQPKPFKTQPGTAKRFGIAESAVVAEGDLHDWFAISQPGFYRVEVEFSFAEKDAPRGRLAPIYFELAP